MRKLIGWTWRIAIIVAFIGTYQIANAWWWQNPEKDAEPVVIEIQKGSSFTQIASMLESEGIIKNDRIFLLYGAYKKESGNIRAGAFELMPGDSYKNILDDLLKVQSTVDIAVTIPEGYTVAQIGDVMKEKMGIESEAWAQASEGQEGFLFPDTYRFLPSATAEDIVKKMRDNFDARMKGANLAPTRNQVIIASILEREVRKADEMANVSDIIRKRLEINMALQMDSTVNYVTQGGRASVTYKDLEVDSPYNTYKYPGLPPGPIGNPGLNAIRAAISPQNNPYFYFLTDPEGRVYYGKTFDEHIANRRFLR